MRRLIFALILLIYTLGAYPCLAQTNVIWKWVDGAGKEHFTGNFNSIPESYRNSAVQGQFMPDKPLRDNNKPPKNLNPKLKVTNKLEVFEEKYFEEKFRQIIKFVGQISEVDISSEMLEKDESLQKIYQKDSLENSDVSPDQFSKHLENKFFKVPKVIE